MEKKTLNKNCIEINIAYFPFQLPIAQYNDSIKIEIMLTHMSNFTEKKNASGNSCILSFLDLYCRIAVLSFCSFRLHVYGLNNKKNSPLSIQRYRKNKSTCSQSLSGTMI